MEIFIVGTINRTILKRFSLCKKTRSKVIYEVITYIGAHRKGKLWREFVLWLSWNSLPHPLISTSKITGCLTKLNNLFVTLDKNNVVLEKISFPEEALDPPAKMHFWACCVQLSIPGWNSTQSPLWGFKSESKPVISGAELFAVNWITVAQKGYNWRLQEVIDWT